MKSKLTRRMAAFLTALVLVLSDITVPAAAFEYEGTVEEYGSEAETEAVYEAEEETEDEEAEAEETEAEEETEVSETEAAETEAEVSETEAEETEAEVTETEAIETEAEVSETEVAETEIEETEAEAAETEVSETEAEEPEVTETEVIETEAEETETEEIETEAEETEAGETETEVEETEAGETETEAEETEAEETETEAEETEAEETETEAEETEAEEIEEVSEEEDLSDEVQAATTYTITYELKNGTNNPNNPTSYTTTMPLFTLLAPTRKGYTFVGWYTDSARTAQITQVGKGMRGNLTLYAKWRNNKYTVKFYANGGTGTTPKLSAKYNYTYTLPANGFTYDGYVFQGWCKTSAADVVDFVDGEEVKNLTYKDGKTLALYAVWLKIPFYLEAVAETNSAYNRVSKKGIQCGAAYQAFDYNAENVFLHLDVAHCVTKVDTGDKLYTNNGVNYYFDFMRCANLAESVDLFRAYGGRTVTIVLVCSEPIKGLTYTKNTGAAYYALNTWSATPKAHVTTLVKKIAGYLGKSVDYWVVGNEINCPHTYHETGEMTLTKYVESYTELLRIVNNAMVKKNPDVSVLVPFDQGWTHTGGVGYSDFHYSAKSILTKIKSLTADNDFNWGISLHPYPVNLNSADWWHDTETYAFAIQNHENTDMYTMANIGTITSYLAKNFKYNGSRRKICITEVGFNAKTNGKKNEALQAASLAYAYYKAEADPNIDLFIYNAMTDGWDPNYLFGLEDADGNKRKSYKVFLYMDTTRGRYYTEQYLSKLPMDKWTSLVPNLKFTQFERKGTLTPLYYDSTKLYFRYKNDIQDYTGAVKYKSKYYYCKNGVVDLRKNGTVKLGGITYTVKKGIIQGL